MEIKKVYLRKNDGTKFITIPKGSSIQAGDYVIIKKINFSDKEFQKLNVGEENGRNE